MSVPRGAVDLKGRVRIRTMSRQKRKTGFTLIELLVVISIIALLVSILLPSLAKARDQAKKVACQSNLSQLSLAWRMYLDDNNETFPYVHEERFGGVAGTWPDYQRGNRRLTSYAGDGRLFRCPADHGYGGLENCFEQLGTSYVYNCRGNVNTYGYGLALKKVTSLNLPLDKIILIGDAGIGTYWNSYPILPPWLVVNPPWWHDRTKALMNVLFVDLHVGTVHIVPTPDAARTGGSVDPDGRWTFQSGWYGPHPISRWGLTFPPYW